MTPAEGQRKVFKHDALGLIAQSMRSRIKCISALDGGWPCASNARQRLTKRSVSLPREGQQVVTIQARAVDKNAAAHDVEKHVGPVMRRGHHITRLLEGVGAAEQFVQTGGVSVACRFDVSGRATAVFKPSAQLEDFDLRPRCVNDQKPLQASGAHVGVSADVGADLGVKVNEKGSTAATGQGLGLNTAVTAERRHLMR